jgi:hypothetical protein
MNKDPLMVSPVSVYRARRLTFFIADLNRSLASAFVRCTRYRCDAMLQLKPKSHLLLLYIREEQKMNEHEYTGIYRF